MDRPSKALLKRLGEWQDDSLELLTRFLLAKMLLIEIGEARREGFEAARKMTMDPDVVVTQYPRLKYLTYEDYFKELEKDEIT